MGLTLNENGYLERGLHRTTLEEFRKRFGYNKVRREHLKNLERVYALAQAIGALRIYIGGSFVTAKKAPSDLDGILITPRQFYAPSDEAMWLLKGSKKLFNIDLVVRPEDDDEEINWWLRFFGHDEDDNEKGLVEIRISSSQ